jgi:hypothetical protein
MHRSLISLCLMLSLATACGSDDGGEDLPEVITTVVLTFTPPGDGPDIVVEFDDPDGPGGDPATIDPIELTAGEYGLAIGFENRLEDPPEIITDEIRDEAEQHQVFLTGDAVDGPASDQPGAPFTHAYADEDLNTLPVGLTNTITAATGTGTLTVTLRHLPPIDGNPTKTATTAADVRAGGFSAIGGQSDAQVDFPATIP